MNCHTHAHTNTLKPQTETFYCVYVDVENHFETLTTRKLWTE